MPWLLIAIAITLMPARAEVGWTELPHTGGDITFEPAQPKPSPAATQAPVAQPEEPDSAAGLPPEDQALIRQHQALRKTFSTMNVTNPVSEDFTGNGVKERFARYVGLSPAMIERISGSRTLMRLAGYVTSPEVITDFKKVLETPVRSPWITVELGWVIVFFVYRGWRLSIVKGFGRRMFERAWIYGVFLVGSLFVIPWLVYGNPYYRLITGAFSILFT